MKNRLFLKNQVQKAVRVLEAGGLLLYPTDTVWGIGCDATHPAAVQRIFELKQRAEEKSLIVLADSVSRVSIYVEQLPLIGVSLLTETTVPQTVVLPRAIGLASAVISADQTAAFRIVSHGFCQALLAAFQKPIVSTSANISGCLAPSSFWEIESRIRGGVDGIVSFLMDENSTRQPSRVISLDITGDIRILRQ